MRQDEQLQATQVQKYVDGDLDYPVTPEQEQEYLAHEDTVVAIHEACHAVAGWILGLPISGMKFNDSTHDRVAEIAQGEKFDVMISQPKGERLVHGLHHGFVTLAGVFGAELKFSENPFYAMRIRHHLQEAAQKIMVIAGISEEEAREHGARLVPVVADIFDDPRVLETRTILADTFLAQRSMTGAEVTSVIEAAWVEQSKAATTGI